MGGMCLMHVVGGVALRDLDPGRAFIGSNALMRPRGTMSRRVLTKRESAARLRSVRLPPDSCRMVRTSAGPGRANKRLAVERRRASGRSRAWAPWPGYKLLEGRAGPNDFVKSLR